MRDRDNHCVPRCGADRTYRGAGPAPWWKHATLCPAREFRRDNPTVEAAYLWNRYLGRPAPDQDTD